ncbi:MAG: response regulator [Bacteroidota bacterium]
MTIQPDYIIIDDETLHTVVCKYQIARVHDKATVKTFTDPQKGLDYLKEFISEPIKNKTIVLLDINMPGLSGWELLDEIESTEQIPFDKLSIYMHTTSINPIDEEATKANPHIAGFIPKPLTVEALQAI